MLQHSIEAVKSAAEKTLLIMKLNTVTEDWCFKKGQQVV
jgi:hypothetical protein